MKLQFELFNEENKSKVKEKVKYEPSKIIEDKINWLEQKIKYTNDTNKYTWYGTFTDKQEIEKGLIGENYFITINNATWLEARKFMLKKFQTKFKEVLRYEEMNFKGKQEYLFIDLTKKQDLTWAL